MVGIFEGFEFRLHKVLSASRRLESGGREPNMPYKVLGARRGMFARRCRDVHEVDEAKAVHKVISSVSSMIREIDDVEERGEERSVNLDGRDALTRDMDVLVMIQAHCFSSSALWCPRVLAAMFTPVVTHTCVEVEARLAFSLSFNVRGTFRPKRRRAR